MSIWQSTEVDAGLGLAVVSTRNREWDTMVH